MSEVFVSDMETMKGVLFAPGSMVGPEVFQLLSELEFSDSGTRRICLHDCAEAPLHVMVIESKCDSNYPAHSHSDGDEFILLLSGSLRLTFWDASDGKAKRMDCVLLDACHKVGPSGVLIRQGRVHSTEPICGPSIHLEVKLGPFRRERLLTFPGIST